MHYSDNTNASLEWFKLLLASGCFQNYNYELEGMRHDNFCISHVLPFFSEMALNMNMVDILDFIFLCGITWFKDFRQRTETLVEALKSTKKDHCLKNAECITEHLQNLMSLKCFSRISVRNSVLRTNKSITLEERINTLELPVPLQNYLLFYYSLGTTIQTS